MGEQFHIDSNAIYGDGALVLGLDVTYAALSRTRRDGHLRYTRKGKRVLYRGGWIIDWLERDGPSAKETNEVMR